MIIIQIAGGWETSSSSMHYIRNLKVLEQKQSWIYRGLNNSKIQAESRRT